MKQKRSYKLFLPLILAVLVVLNFSGAVKISVNDLLNGVKNHQTRLHSLYLTEGFDEDNESEFLVGMTTNNNHLVISNGLLVGNNIITGSKLATIGGGQGNTIENANYAGIAGGNGNKISAGNNSVIGGGSNNTIEGSDAVIAGGNNNEAGTGGIVVGGSNNKAYNKGVVFGGENNTANGANSLILGKNAEGGDGSFAWNGFASNSSAYIGAKNGVLIGTYNPIEGVNLVVNGAIKLGGEDTTPGVAGEIRVVGGCFYAYDGEYWHVINQSGKGNCTSSLSVPDTCEFGAVQLQAGDRVIAYKDKISSNCSSNEVVCSNGELISISNPSEKSYIYPYCHEL